MKQKISFDKDERHLEVKAPSLTVSFNLRKGMSLESLFFNKVSSQALLGEIPLGYYHDISLAADFFSGHSVIEKPGEHKATSLNNCKPVFYFADDGSFVIESESSGSGIMFKSHNVIEDNKIILKKELLFPERKPVRVMQYIFTFIPESWDVETLYYATHNGGRNVEYFNISGHIINQQEPLSLLISAKHGLGATEGFIKVGDKNKELIFKFNQELSALIPSIVFQKSDCGKYFFRLVFSAGEIDETFKSDSNPFSIVSEIEIFCNS
jgi:hypothetical protein